VCAKTALIILDNCEHLIEGCAQFADTVLRAAPQVKILASSREALGIAGEVAFRVPSLAIPDARQTTSIETLTQCESVRLFVERAATALPGFSVTPDNALAVVQVSQRLDGIPLAIELAAARVNVLRVEQIAARLNDAFRLLTGGSRTALPRQQTLRALIDWSYGLLSKTERTLFRRLAVFASGWTLDAAEAVCTGNGIQPDEILDLLTRLVDKSLVVAEREQGQETRYHFLETIRQYARDKLLESGEADLVRARHLDYFMQFAVIADHTRLDTEHDNLRAAMDWAVESGRAQSGLRLGAALQFFWYRHGYWREGRERLERLLARPEAAAHTTTRADALNVAGFLAGWLGDSEAAQALLEESRAISLELGEAGKPALTRSLFYLAKEMINRDKALAQLMLDENLALARETGDTWVIGWTLFFQGSLAIRQGDYALARTFFGESLAQFRKDGNQGSAASSIKALGWVSYLLEDYSAARSQFEEVVPIYREIGDKFSMAQALENLGYVTYQQGAYQQAIALFEESLARFRELERKDTIAWLLGDLGIAAGQQGDQTRAAALLGEALPLTQEVGDVSLSAMCLIGLAGIQQQSIRAAQLLAAAQTAFEASDEIVEPFHRAAQERIDNAARAALGEEMFVSAWAAGRAMSLEQAIAFALEETDD
jgi:predicted ATPase